MVTRRRLFVGSAGLVGAIAVPLGTTAARASNGRQIPVTLPAGTVSGFPLPGGLICPVPFMSRSAWGADESLRYSNNGGYWPEEFYPAQTITVHHTGFVADPDPAQTVRDIYVRQTLQGDGSAGAIGWGDIGYNLLIDDQGVVYEGRYSGADGYPVFNESRGIVTAAHAKHYNQGNIGVCLIGYLTDTPATPAAQQSLVTVLAYLAAVGRVNPTGSVKYVNPAYPTYTKSVLGVSGHRNWAATDCPGSAFYPLLSQIRSAAAAAMPKLDPPPPPTAGEPTPTQTGGESSPATSQPATPSPSTTPASTPRPSPTKKPSTTRDRGGDEYVPVARSASPKAYPTKRPAATPSPSVTASPTSASAVPTSTPSQSWAPLSGSTSDLSSASGLGWWSGATMVGVAAAGALSAWWLRRRRLATSPVAAEPPTKVDTAATDIPVDVPPAASDEITDAGAT